MRIPMTKINEASLEPVSETFSVSDKDHALVPYSFWQPNLVMRQIKIRSAELTLHQAIFAASRQLTKSGYEGNPNQIRGKLINVVAEMKDQFFGGNPDKSLQATASSKTQTPKKRKHSNGLGNASERNKDKKKSDKMHKGDEKNESALTNDDCKAYYRCSEAQIEIIKNSFINQIVCASSKPTSVGKNINFKVSNTTNVQGSKENLQSILIIINNNPSRRSISDKIKNKILNKYNSNPLHAVKLAVTQIGKFNFILPEKAKHELGTPEGRQRIFTASEPLIKLLNQSGVKLYQATIGQDFEILKSIYNFFKKFRGDSIQENARGSKAKKTSPSSEKKSSPIANRSPARQVTRETLISMDEAESDYDRQSESDDPPVSARVKQRHSRLRRYSSSPQNGIVMPGFSSMSALLEVATMELTPTKGIVSRAEVNSTDDDSMVIEQEQENEKENSDIDDCIALEEDAKQSEWSMQPSLIEAYRQTPRNQNLIPPFLRDDEKREISLPEGVVIYQATEKNLQSIAVIMSKKPFGNHLAAEFIAEYGELGHLLGYHLLQPYNSNESYPIKLAATLHGTFMFIVTMQGGHELCSPEGRRRIHAGIKPLIQILKSKNITVEILNEELEKQVWETLTQFIRLSIPNPVKPIPMMTPIPATRKKVGVPHSSPNPNTNPRKRTREDGENLAPEVTLIKRSKTNSPWAGSLALLSPHSGQNGFSKEIEEPQAQLVLG